MQLLTPWYNRSRGYHLWEMIQPPGSICDLPSNSNPRYLLERKECICHPKDKYKNVHNSFLHSCPHLETTQTSIKRTDKLEYYTA